MGSSPRRRARNVASALLLGLLLFLLVDGGWTEPPGLYAYASLDAIFVFSVRNPLLRRAAIALIVCHGLIAVAKSNKQSSAILSFRATWVLALTLAVVHTIAWREYTASVGRNVYAVFELARSAPPGSPFAGTYGALGALGSTAISSDDRFAIEVSGCMGVYGLWWGHTISSGPWLRLVVESGPSYAPWSAVNRRWLPIRLKNGNRLLLSDEDVRALDDAKHARLMHELWHEDIAELVRDALDRRL